MKKVPITRFKREFRKHMRIGEPLAITKCGKIYAMFLPTDIYDILVKNLQ